MNDCVPWWGYITQHGYGQVYRLRSKQYAHRMVWEECFGPLEDGVVLHHRCHNKTCVNPEHLEPLTGHGAHVRTHTAEKTHCIHGHEFTPENTYSRPDTGTRVCRECLRQRAQENLAPCHVCGEVERPYGTMCARCWRKQNRDW